MNTITFIFPHPVAGPTGGYKVVYEYANRLVADGHRVNIVYSGSLFWRKKSLYFKLTNCVRYIQMLIKGYGCRNGYIIPAFDKSKFAERLEWLMNHESARHKMIHECQESVNRFDAKIIAQQWIVLFKNLISEC